MESTCIVEIGDESAAEFHVLREQVQTEVLALARVLQQFGPQLGLWFVKIRSACAISDLGFMLFRWKSVV